MKNAIYSGNRPTDNAAKIRRACSVLLPLCFLSILIAALSISVANDMYAFVKRDASATVTLDTPESVYETAKKLEEHGIINNPAIFTLYVRSKNADERILSFSGELKLDSSMSYRDILRSFS